MKKIFLSLTLLFTIAAGAQHDNTWYFGRWAGINFSSGVPVALTDSQMWAVEGCGAISDENGNLLFYTNGVSVWNKNHQLMQNGTGLFGNGSTTQAAMIIPKPGDDSNYYIFTPDSEGGTNGLHYSEVDMEGAGGMGVVINKNIQLVTPVCEKVAATFHQNGIDIWVTTHHWGSNAYYSYLVTAQGVNPVPVISNVGADIGGANNSGRYAGQMAFSPDGSHLAALHHNVTLELLDFNNATGILSNPSVVKEGVVQGYGVEFSPSGDLLYASSDFQILQYQVNAADIPATQIVLATTQNIHGSIKIGPDSKLYVVNRVLHPDISVINNPDVPGTGCNFVYDQVNLAGRATFLGLPTFLTSPFYLQDIISTADCTGSQFAFSVQATLPAETITWDFGDGNTGEGINVDHTYTASGIYTVRATARRGIFVRYYSKTIDVIIVPAPVANQPQDMIVCDAGNDGQEVFDLTLLNNQILEAQSSTDHTVTYHVSAENAEEGINALPGDYTNTVNPQLIFARITNNSTGCYSTTSFSLILKPVPVIDMSDTYFTCDNNLVVLTAPAGFDTYTWSTGETTRTIFATTGNYALTVTKNYGGIICEGTKELTVSGSSAPVISEIITSDWSDTSNSIRIIATGEGDYEYSLDGVYYQDDPFFEGLVPGFYTVYVRDKNGCGADEEEAALLMYPRFFTPNGDGQNDFWRIKFAVYEPEMITHIYDRYGKLVYSFKGDNEGWDGSYNGRRLPSSDYWFLVKRKSGKEFMGHFSMIR